MVSMSNLPVFFDSRAFPNSQASAGLEKYLVTRDMGPHGSNANRKPGLSVCPRDLFIGTNVAGWSWNSSNSHRSAVVIFLW